MKERGTSTTAPGTQAYSGNNPASENPAKIPRLTFNRLELAGAFGDLGTMLPIVIGMMLLNGLSPTTVFLAFGIFYLVSGLYYGLPIPVQPLKAVGAIAIAYPTMITEPVIGAAGILFGAMLLTLSLTGMVDRVAQFFSQAVVRGIQLTLGLIFLRKGFELIVHSNVFPTGVPGILTGQASNLIIGVLVFALVLWLLNNKRYPAALAALGGGIGLGLVLGGFSGQNLSLGPTAVQLIKPSLADFWTALIMLVLPQIPLTIGNACVGTANTCTTLFSGNPMLIKTKAGKFAFSMGLINFPAGFFGAIPMCHGTGGLAAHYRFGARTGGAPVMIGFFFILLALVLGEFGFALLATIPQSVLGVLLVFAGLELCPLMRSLQTNEEYFVALLIAGIALVVPNMAWAFVVGIAVDMAIRRWKIKI